MLVYLEISKFNWQTFIFKWVTTVFGTGLIAHFVMAGDKVTEAMISFGATVVYPLLVSLFEGFIEGAKNEADEKGQAFGKAFVKFITAFYF